MSMLTSALTLSNEFAYVFHFRDGSMATEMFRDFGSPSCSIKSDVYIFKSVTFNHERDEAIPNSILDQKNHLSII